MVLSSNTHSLSVIANSYLKCGVLDMKNKTDLRVLRSRTLIKRAFLQLLEQDSYDELTISQIATCAMVNRKTFYLHYNDKADLLLHVIEELLSEYPILKTPVPFRQWMETLTNTLSRQRTTLRLLLREDPTRAPLQTSLEQYLHDTLLPLYQQQNHYFPQKPWDLLVRKQLSALFLSQLHWWVMLEPEKEAHYRNAFLSTSSALLQQATNLLYRSENPSLS